MLRKGHFGDRNLQTIGHACAFVSESCSPPAGLRAGRQTGAGTRAGSCILYLYRRHRPPAPASLLRMRNAHLKTPKVKIAHHGIARCSTPFRAITASETLISSEDTSGPASSAPQDGRCPPGDTTRHCGSSASRIS